MKTFGNDFFHGNFARQLWCGIATLSKNALPNKIKRPVFTQVNMDIVKGETKIRRQRHARKKDLTSESWSFQYEFSGKRLA
jgi:hypothetical protein